MESKRKQEIIARITRNGEREYVTSPLEVGATVTFTKVGEPQVFNNNTWDPVEDNEGHRISLSKIVYGRNIKFNSNKLADRIEATINAIENPKGLKLKVSNITKRDVLDANGNPVLDSEGKVQQTNVYHWSKELVG